MTAELRSIYSGPIRRALERAGQRLMQVEPTDWETITPLLGWTHVAGNEPFTCRRKGDEIQVRGYIQHAAAPTPSGGAVIGMLPEEFWPPTWVSRTIAYKPTSAAHQMTSINFTNNGEILYYGSTDSIDYLIIDMVGFSLTP